MTRAHVLVNVIAGAVATAAALGPAPWRSLDTAPVLAAVLIACTAFLTARVLDVLPALNAAIRQGRSS